MVRLQRTKSAPGKVPLLQISGNGTTNALDRGGNVVTANNAVGAIRYGPHPNARVNLIANSRFENDALSWAGQNSATVSRITDDGERSTCAQVVGSGINGSGIIQTSSLPYPSINAGATYTLSFDYKVVTPGVSMTVSLNGFNGSSVYIGGSGWPSEVVSIASTTGWIRYVKTGTISAGTTVNKIGLAVTLGTSTAVLRITNIVFETGTVTNPTHFDGVGFDPFSLQTAVRDRNAKAEKLQFFIEEGTTNTIRNPQLFTATTGYSPLASTLTRDTSYAYIGTASLKVVTNAVSMDGFHTSKTDTPAVAGQTWTFSTWLRGSGSVVVRLTGILTDGTNLSADTSTSGTITLTNVWTRYSITITLADAATVYLSARVLTSSAQSATFYATNMQLEQKAYATSYTDGTLGNGYAWTGSAHASSSTRTAAQLRYSIPTSDRFNTNRGSLVVRHMIPNLSAFSSTATIVRAGQYNGNPGDQITLDRTSSSNLQAQATTNGSLVSALSTQAVAANTPYNSYVEWTPTTFNAGASMTGTILSGARSSATGSITTASQMLYVGSLDGTQHHNGFIGEVSVYDDVLTSDERTRLNAFLFWETTSLKQFSTTAKRVRSVLKLVRGRAQTLRLKRKKIRPQLRRTNSRVSLRRTHMSNFSIIQGDTYVETLTVTDANGAATDITGGKLYFTVKTDYSVADGSAALALTSPSNGIVLTTPASGIATMTITAAQAAALTANQTYVYDIQYKDAGGIVTTLDIGTMTVTPQVTQSTA